VKYVFLIAAAILALSACSKPPATPASEVATADVARTVFPRASIEGLPAGEYVTDAVHSSLTFKVNHQGFSHYTARFDDFKATLTLDPAHPEAAALSVTIVPASLGLNAPPKGFHDELMGKMFFDAKTYPGISFKSTKVVKTGEFTAKVTGDLTLHGVTKPVALDVTFNGGYPGLAGLDPNARIGFSAKGLLQRSDFGMGYGVPAAGSRLGVSDDVEFEVQTEMQGPDLKPESAKS